MNGRITVVVGVLTATFLLVSSTGTAQAVESFPEPADCTAQIQLPHASHHFPGTVNVIATTSCRSTKARISGNVNLFREAPNPRYSINLPPGGTKTAENVSKQSLNAAANECVNGAKYHAKVWFGYSTDGVNTFMLERESPVVTITDC